VNLVKMMIRLNHCSIESGLPIRERNFRISSLSNLLTGTRSRLKLTGIIGLKNGIRKIQNVKIANLTKSSIWTHPQNQWQSMWTSLTGMLSFQICGTTFQGVCRNQDSIRESQWNRWCAIGELSGLK
jgi:hypothetical protein